MQIQNVPITTVKTYEKKNPRFIDDTIDAVVCSIMEFSTKPTEESRAMRDIVRLTFVIWGIFAQRGVRIQNLSSQQVKKTPLTSRWCVNQMNGGVYRPISAPLFMRGEPTHRSFFAVFSCDKNRNLCDISAEKSE